MQFDEKILWGVGAVVLVALIIAHRKVPGIDVPAYLSPVADVGMSFTPENTPMTKGPRYLMYNRPYAFAPPVGNVLPTQTAGQAGQTVQNPSPFVQRFCETC